MATNHKVQCDYKRRFVVDVITNDKHEQICRVWLYPNKKGMHNYCKETGLPFKTAHGRLKTFFRERNSTG